MKYPRPSILSMSRNTSRSARTARIEIYRSWAGNVEDIQSRSARTARIEIKEDFSAYQKIQDVAVRKDRED